MDPRSSSRIFSCRPWGQVLSEPLIGASMRRPRFMPGLSCSALGCPYQLWNSGFCREFQVPPSSVFLGGEAKLSKNIETIASVITDNPAMAAPNIMSSLFSFGELKLALLLYAIYDAWVFIPDCEERVEKS